MSIINIMDENLANKISAGEIVEKCSSVVKELVENSIDAKSENIKIELIKSGTKQIKVVDDGIGMDSEDAVNCFLRHATSKIKRADDLFFINTLGFRGEALASIASVSEVILSTCKETQGTFVSINGGLIKEVGIGSPRKGTSITINNLFYNTPARLKFLKSLNTELFNIVSLVEKLALSNPNISFYLNNDGKNILRTNGRGELLKTIHEIYGNNISKNLVPVNGENYDFEANGYISNINISKSNKNHILVFVNGRIIKNSYINKIIKDGYHTFLAENKYPIIFLNITCDPTLLDVNIHPTKQDIKISKMESLGDFLFNLIRDTLNKTDNIYKIENESKENLKINEGSELYNKESLQSNINFSFENDIIDNNEIKNNDYKERIFPVGLVMGTYLICQDKENMYLADIHAANERINYEKYLNALKSDVVNTTSMLFPLMLEFTKNEYMVINEKIDFIKSLGFKIEEFGINTFKISEHPTWLLSGYEEQSIKKIFDLIININEKFDRCKFNEYLAINLACKMSVKANTSLSISEEETLIRRLYNCEFPYTCPHGRPTIIKYSNYELEKLFKRVI